MAMTCSYRSLNGRHLNIWMWWLIGMAPGHLGQMSPVRPDIIQNDPVRCCRITVYYFKIPAWRGKLCWLDRSMDYWWKCLYIHGKWLESHYGAVNDICTLYSVQYIHILDILNILTSRWKLFYNLFKHENYTQLSPDYFVVILIKLSSNAMR